MSDWHWLVCKSANKRRYVMVDLHECVDQRQSSETDDVSWTPSFHRVCQKLRTHQHGRPSRLCQLVDIHGLLRDCVDQASTAAAAAVTSHHRNY